MLEQLGVVFDEIVGRLVQFLRDGAAQLMAAFFEEFLFAELGLRRGAQT